MADSPPRPWTRLAPWRALALSKPHSRLVPVPADVPVQLRECHGRDPPRRQAGCPGVRGDLVESVGQAITDCTNSSSKPVHQAVEADYGVRGRGLWFGRLIRAVQGDQGVKQVHGGWPIRGFVISGIFLTSSTGGSLSKARRRLWGRRQAEM